MILHWRSHHYGDGIRFGFQIGADEIAHRLSNWLLGNATFVSPDWPYDLALLYESLAARNQLAAFEMEDRFYEIGSVAGLVELQRHLAA